MMMMQEHQAPRFVGSSSGRGLDPAGSADPAATWVPACWGGGQGSVRTSSVVDEAAGGAAVFENGACVGAPPYYGDDIGGGGEEMVMMMLSQQQHSNEKQEEQRQPGRLRVRVDSVIEDSDEEMEPFDAERFVDRLVEEVEPPTWRCQALPGVGDVWEAIKPSTPSESGGAAKLFLHLPPPQPPGQQQQPFLLDGPPGFDGASQHQQHHHEHLYQHHHQEEDEGMPIVVPHDPILDALFTPCRVPAAAVTLGLVRVDPKFGYNCANGEGGGGGINKKGIMGFEPAQVYNIPPPAEMYAAPLQVPMAPLRQPSGGRLGVGFYSPGTNLGGTNLVQSAEIISSSRSRLNNTTYLNAKAPNPSNNIPGNVSGAAPETAAASAVTAAVATAAAAAAAAETTVVSVPLTGADSHLSQEYDDERHAFLRRKEMELYVGPEYLAGYGAATVGSAAVTPAERVAAVDWISALHKAAPAASGGGGEALSLDTLFLAVNLLDRFLSTDEGIRVVYNGVGGLGGGDGGGWPRREVKLSGAACLALSSKYHDTHAVSLWGVAVASTSSSLSTSPTEVSLQGGGGGGGDFFGVLEQKQGDDSSSGDGHSSSTSTVDGSAARKELAAMEMRVASSLGFRLTVPTALSFLGVYLRRAGALGYLQADAPSSERVREEAQQILLCVVRDASSLDHPPSALAASALYWASCVTSPASPPPPPLAFLAVTGYELEQLCRCLRDMECVRTGVGGRHGSGSSSSPCGSRGESGAGSFGGDWAGAAFPEHADKSLFGAGGVHPAIAAL